jgi:NDP-sugar pyrophosphorylase family protein
MALLPFPQKDKTIVYVRGTKVVSIGVEPKDKTDIRECSFTAVSIVTEKLLKLLPSQGFSSIIEAYNKAFELGLVVNAYMHDGYWFDIGTPKDYFTVHVKLAHLNQNYVDASRHKLQTMNDNIRIKDNVFFMGTNCIVHSGCTFQNCIVLDNVTIQPNTVVQDCILYRDLSVPLD